MAMTAGAGPLHQDQIRLDVWLNAARFCNGRPRAQELIESAKIRVNRALVLKPGYRVRPGDVLTLQHQNAIRVVRILKLTARRGPAALARELYDDLAEPSALSPDLAPNALKSEPSRALGV